MTTPFGLLLALSVVPVLACVELAKAIRWRALIGMGQPNLARCLRALVAGQLANALVPLRAGEVLTVGLVKVEGGPLVAGATALAGTKALDALTLAGIAVLLLGAAALPHPGLGLAVAAAALALGLLAVVASWRRTARWLHTTRLPHRLHLHELLDVAASVREGRTLLILVSTSAVVWLAGLTANCLVLAAAGVTPDLEIAARMLVAGYVVGLLPAPPARVGVFEAGIVAALSSAGIGLTQAVGAGVILHACQLAELGLLLAGSLAWTKWGGRTPVPKPSSQPS